MIDVVVLTKTPAFFARSRASLDGQGVPYHGIVVVSDGADLGDAADGWTVLHAGENHSYARSMNYAATQCVHDRVLHYSDDAILAAGSIAASLKHEAPIVGFTVFGDDAAKWNWGMCWGLGFDRHGLSYDKPMEWRERGCVTDVQQAVTFAAVLLDRAMLTDVGFDEDYHYCYDDVDFQLRARERGYPPAMACWCAWVQHTSAQTRGDNTAPNLATYRRKWPPERVDAALGRVLT